VQPGEHLIGDLIEIRERGDLPGQLAQVSGVVVGPPGDRPFAGTPITFGLHPPATRGHRRSGGELTVMPRVNDNRARAKSASPRTIPVGLQVIRLYADYQHGEYGDLNSDYIFVNLWGSHSAGR
jgi:hypothetical protein